jgi:hypothetical protein
MGTTHQLLWREPHSKAQLAGRLHHLLDKTGGQINGGNISPLPDGDKQNAKLAKPVGGWGNTVTVWLKQNILPPWGNW